MSNVKAELIDVADQWHYLAGEAEKLYQREIQLEAVAGLEPQDGPSSIWNGPCSQTANSFTQMG